MDKHENIFYLRLYQDGNPQIIKEYIQGLCNVLNEKNLDFHLDFHLDTMFQDEVFSGGEGMRTTYPYHKFEKTFDDINKYFSFDMDSSNHIMSAMDDTIQTIDSLSSSSVPTDEVDKNEEDEKVDTCKQLLLKIPEDVQNELTFNLKIFTETPQLYHYGGITQLEYFLKNV
jgi:hypothetical protein|uniref:Uncharacterized protein n=1 Tax=viral metagenome TaxID=1070528 RepID=A0A6C0IR90_9ZZZZ